MNFFKTFGERRGLSPVEAKLSRNEFGTGFGFETFVRFVADASFATVRCCDISSDASLDGQIESEGVAVVVVVVVVVVV